MKRFILLPIAVVASIVFGLGGGTAFAYLTSSGSGTGSATTGTLVAVTTTATLGTPKAPLYPGGTGDVILEIKNSNSFDVTLKSVTAVSSNITADNGHSGCTTTGVTFTNQTSLNMNLTGGATTEVDLVGAASMDSTSLSACQGATFTVPVTIAVQK